MENKGVSSLGGRGDVDVGFRRDARVGVDEGRRMVGTVSGVRDLICDCSVMPWLVRGVKLSCEIETVV